MRGGIILAAAFMLMAASTARAEEWCGYAAQAKSVIECGYSTAAECENTIGKGGMCFVDPELAFRLKRPSPATAIRAGAIKSRAG